MRLFSFLKVELALLLWFGWFLFAFGCGAAPEPSHAPTTTAAVLPVGHKEPLPTIPSHAAHLVAAYPDHLQGMEGNEIVWRDGTRMVWDDMRGEKAFAELEAKPDLEDMFVFPYPDSVIFKEDFDPGRIRNEAFFKKMYGATAAEVGKRLTSVKWVDGTSLKVTTVNHVDQRLAAVADSLRRLPALQQYLTPAGGTFNWRVIAGTDRLSAHSYGIAIDISTRYSDYWRWAPEFKAGKPLRYRNQIPMAIVRVFEWQGFIWGGKWYHYDTMHFEYRPEMLAFGIEDGGLRIEN